MVKLGLYIRLEARAGQEKALEAFLASALPLALAEPQTPVWYAVKFAPNSFAIFDAFAAEEDRVTHLQGPIAAALIGQADALLTAPPKIERWEALAVK